MVLPGASWIHGFNKYFLKHLPTVWPTLDLMQSLRAFSDEGTWTEYPPPLTPRLQGGPGKGEGRVDTVK